MENINKYSADGLREILSRHGKILKKSLGQNFLFDRKILDSIVSASVGDKKENILEIGAGVGLLTEMLCQNARKVVTVEIDNTLPDILRETVPQDNFVLHLEDVLKADFPSLSKRHFGAEKFTVVGNLPYYITGKILDKLMQNISLCHRAVIMVQREVAKRLQSKPGSKEYRAVTAQVQALFEVEYIVTVPPHCFVPAPHVDSAVIRLTPRQNAVVKPQDVTEYLHFVCMAFSSRRKQLKSLAGTLGTTPDKVVQSLATLGFDETMRAESLTPDQLAELFYLLKG
ncbi:MAG: ribosomal RNA small subunit methyltransferase A [Clostridia bacterium]|nr:ribosomal RNA small subunit methyltransferase A [Clostridia bacterium]